MKKIIFTLGHSNHEIKKFIDLLKMHAITAVCDVRSAPFSTYNPHYNQDNLKRILLDNNIKYVFLGKELGARSNDKNCYKNGQVQFELLAKTELFQNGLARVIQGANTFKIALVCAEKAPTQCHRTFLVARELEKNGFSIFHILEDGKIETQDELIAKITKETNSSQEYDFFLTQNEMRQKIYTEQSIKMSYTMSD
jgi:uncharacterized protein (DUF488 family)